VSPPKKAETLAELYDNALAYARDGKLPPDAPRPRPTADWPRENLALLEQYRDWLVSGGASAFTIKLIYLVMAGHVLGLNLKPSADLDLDADLQKALDYVIAKQQSAEWTKVNRNALDKFRRFLRHQRGQLEIHVNTYDPRAHTQRLPEWLVTELEHFQHLRERTWRPARLQDGIRRFWSNYLRTWRFLVEQCGVQELGDLRRTHLYRYIEHRSQAGKAVSGINGDLRDLRAFLLFLQDQGYSLPQSLLRMPSLKQPDSLPKYLTDEQVRTLREVIEGRVSQAGNAAQRRDALLDRAIFYLLWQAGLRKGEVEELRLEDLDLEGHRLTVRHGKGMVDRTVFLTTSVVESVKAYLAMRGMGPTDHVFLYRNQPINKDLIHGRLKALGEQLGIKIHPHRLRHTCATQLLNAGCRITSIQKFLGHRRLNSTLVYARVYDQTVEEDYYTAMNRVEQRLELAGEQAKEAAPIPQNERQQLLSLAELLAQPANRR
jgi:integrase/recombinase XerD